MSSIITKSFNLSGAEDFIASVANRDNYYVCFGKHTPYLGSDSIVETPLDTFKYRDLNLYDNLIFGKRVSSNDVKLMTNKVLWTSGTVYNIYDDSQDLSTKTFFVATPDGTNYNVYKCIFNASGAESTVMPSTVDTNIFIESDGYAWKYLYTISGANWTKFSTNKYMPVYENTSVSSTTIDRSIDVILTEYSGSYYNNHQTGGFESGSQLVSTTQFRLSGSASVFNDFYKGCIIEFTTSSGKEYKEILDYVVSGSIKTITVDSPVENLVEIGDTYQIYPKVKVSGDGFEVTSCLAWALIDSTSSNSVSKIEILRSGEGYRSSTAEVIVDESVGVTDPAILRPIISPKHGHGFNPAAELYANKVCVSVKIDRDESNNIIAANDFRNISLIKNPEFNDINLQYVGTSSVFTIGEEVFQYKPIQLVGTASINTANANIIVGTSTKFENDLSVSDYILVQNSTSSFISKVTTLLSNTSVVVSPSAGANIAGANVFSIEVQSSGKVKTYLSNSVTITEVSNNFTIGSPVIGTTSFAKVITTNILNNSRNTNDLNTLQQTVKFEGSKTNDNQFIEDEVVYESGIYPDESLRPTGTLFTYIDETTDKLFLTNEKNPFSSNAIIVGNTSGAIFNSSNKYSGDLIKDSGDVLYINNVEAITKTEDSSEVFKLTLSF